MKHLVNKGNCDTTVGREALCGIVQTLSVENQVRL